LTPRSGKEGKKREGDAEKKKGKRGVTVGIVEEPLEGKYGPD